MLLMIFKIIKISSQQFLLYYLLIFTKSRIGWKRAKVYSDYLKDCQSKIKFDDVCSEHTIDKVKELKKMVLHPFLQNHQKVLPDQFLKN